MSDPVEDGVTRWEISVPTQWKWESDEGEWVTYADHVAAVQAERERIRTGVDALPYRYNSRDAVRRVIDGGSDE